MTSSVLTRSMRRWLTHRSLERRRCHLESGFTLIELLVVIVVLPLLMGALAEGTILVLRNTAPTDQKGTATRLSNSADAEITSTYFVRDVQSASKVSTNPAPVCSPPGAGPDQVLGLQWTTSTGTTVDISYYVQQSPLALVRYYCSNSTFASTSVVSRDVFSQLTAAGVGPCPVTGFGAGDASCAVDTASRSAYVAALITCSDGSSTTCVSNGSAGTAFGLYGVVEDSSTGIQRVQLLVDENQSTGYQYQLTATPRVTPAGSSGHSVTINPPFLVNGQTNVNNCNVLTNGVMAVNDPASAAISMQPNSGSIASTGFYTTSSDPSNSISGGSATPLPAVSGAPIQSPYDSLVAPPAVPPGATYRIVTITTPNWDPSTDPTYLDPQGNLEPNIYVVTAGMQVSRGLSARNGVLFYVTGGNVGLNGNGNLNLTPLAPNWEVTNPPTSPVQPTPEVVLWIARSDTSPSNPPTLTLGGNGNTTTIVGSVYAPTASVTMNGGGSNGGVNVAALDIGTLQSCNGGGSVPYNLVVGSTFTAGITVTPTTRTTTTGSSLGATVAVFGLGPRAPTGTVTVSECGPVTPGLGCSGGGGISAYPLTQVGPTLTLTQGSTSTSPSTASTAPTAFTPLTPGTWCFSALYSGDVSYGSISDLTTDGCFTVSGPPPPTVADPVSGACYRSSPNGGCSGTWTGYIDGTATDPGGPGVGAVQVAIENPNGKWWDPLTSTFTSTTAVNMTAADTSGNGSWSTWSLAFPSSNLSSSNGSYTIVATITDKSTPPASGLPSSVSFQWKG